jgi:signal peptidase I
MKKFLYEIKDYVIIVVVVILIRTFIITPALVDGASMDNTLKDGQLVIINKFSMIVSKPKRFDIVVVKNNDSHDKIIKRVIGLPNEKIVYRDNNLYINGELYKEDYVLGNTTDYEVETGEDEYFVLGDNREVSKDSRILGNFKKKDIIGKVRIRLFPFNKIGKVK